MCLTKRLKESKVRNFISLRGNFRGPFLIILREFMVNGKTYAIGFVYGLNTIYKYNHMEFVFTLLEKTIKGNLPYWEIFVRISEDIYIDEELFTNIGNKIDEIIGDYDWKEKSTPLNMSYYDCTTDVLPNETKDPDSFVPEEYLFDKIILTIELWNNPELNRVIDDWVAKNFPLNTIIV